MILKDWLRRVFSKPTQIMEIEKLTNPENSVIIKYKEKTKEIEIMNKTEMQAMVRNSMYEHVGQMDAGEFELVGRYEDGLIFQNEEGNFVVVKAIVKNAEFNGFFEVEAYAQDRARKDAEKQERAEAKAKKLAELEAKRAAAEAKKAAKAKEKVEA